MSEPTKSLPPACITRWTVENIKTTQGHIQRALEAAGLDKELSGELVARYAWARAMHTLASDKIVEPIKEDDDTIRFQFNVIVKTGGRAEYPLEAILILDKKTGKVAPDPIDGVIPDIAVKMAADAEKLVAECTDIRTGRDVSRLIHSIAKKNKTLLHAVDGTGVFLVFDDGVLPKIDAFMRFLDPSSDRVIRYPIAAGAEGEKSAAACVTVTLEGLLAERRKAAEAFCTSDKTRRSSVEKDIKRLKETTLQIEMYEALIKGKAVTLKTEMAAIDKMLHAKLVAMDAEKTAVPAEEKAAVPAEEKSAEEAA